MREYYSNCFIEALKAKLRYWDSIRIIFIPPVINDGVPGIPHFMWYDRDDGNVYDFHTNDWLKHWWNTVWWRGHIRVQPLKVFNRWYRSTGHVYIPE